MMTQYGNFINLKGTQADFLGLADLKERSKELVSPTTSFAFFVEKLAERNKAGSSAPLEQTVADLNHRWRDDPDSPQGWKQLKEGLSTYNLLTDDFSNFIQKQIERPTERTQERENGPKFSLRG